MCMWVAQLLLVLSNMDSVFIYIPEYYLEALVNKHFPLGLDLTAVLTHSPAELKVSSLLICFIKLVSFSFVGGGGVLLLSLPQLICLSLSVH